MSLKEDEIEYPCKECLVLVTCSQLCDKIEKNTYVIFKRIKEDKRCPDCGGTHFLKKSRSGTFQNIICATCKHKFNLILIKDIEKDIERDMWGAIV